MISFDVVLRNLAFIFLLLLSGNRPSAQQGIALYFIAENASDRRDAPFVPPPGVLIPWLLEPWDSVVEPLAGNMS